jgi:hypothetical protein
MCANDSVPRNKSTNNQPPEPFCVGDRIYYNRFLVGYPFWITLVETAHHPELGDGFRYETDNGEWGYTSADYLHKPYVALSVVRHD